MSKTVTLEVSDLTSLNFDFMFEMTDAKSVTIRGMTFEGPQVRSAKNLCCNVTILTESMNPSLWVVFGDLARVNGRASRMFKAKDKYTLICRVNAFVMGVIDGSQYQTDPLRVCENGTAIEKFLMASLNVYLEQTSETVAKTIAINGEVV